jgi:hypothetical protein
MMWGVADVFLNVADVIFECCGISSSCCMQHDLIDMVFVTILFECYNI